MVLATAGASGEVTMITRKEVSASPILPAGEQWQAKPFPAHQGEGGVAALSWAPSSSPATLAAGPAAARAALTGPRRLATCGMTDGRVCTWRYDEKGNSWTLHKELADERHGDTVRDVSWRPNIGIPANVIASCGKDGSVMTWVQDMDQQPWRLQAAWDVGGDARRVIWSKSGHLLAVSVGDSDSLLYKEGPIGQWSHVTSTSGGC